MKLAAVFVVALFAIAGCSDEAPSADPESSPTTVETGGPGLPAEFADRVEAACVESVRLSRESNDQEGDEQRETRIRSTQVVADALHAGEIPPEAQDMVDAFDIYFQETVRSIEILDRSDPVEKRLKEAIAAGDKKAVQRARAALEQAVLEAQALFQRATEAYGRFLDYVRDFGLSECAL
jgi:hypothetical protein